MARHIAYYSPSQISWITSLQTCLIVFGGIIVGRLYDIYGAKPLMYPGTVLMILGIMLTSICEKYYQFILAQGILTSLGAAMVFNPCISAISSWFVTKRATALGICNSFSSLGGVIIPIIFRNVQDKAGFGWGVRTVGFVLLVFSIIACICVQPRIPPKGRQPLMFYHSYVLPFKEHAFWISTVGIFFVYWGVFIPISFIPRHAVSNGFSASLASYLTSIQNAASIFGRVLPGFLADRLGRFNIYIFGAFSCAILTLALWIPATGHVPIILYAAFFGFTSGITVTVWQPIVAEISPISEIGSRLGAVSAVQSFASLSGAPIGGAIVSANNGKYWGAAVFASVTMITGGIITQVAKLVVTKGEWWTLD
ncbi:major facilitator superfamily domain-containing protein [Lipomyces japonicus]|uniref:major facilitator superfamily domain-containing protein n=1 Tax=Lipomyces japonicus TaxID=56871 RepID=UPI0034CF2143